MKRRKQSRQFRKASLRALIQRIDSEVDVLVKKRTELGVLPHSEADHRLQAMLKNLRKYHPLNIRSQKHGYRLYIRLLGNKHELYSWLLSEIMISFDVPYGRSPFRWYTRGLFRFVFTAFEIIAEGIQILYAMVKEKR